MFGFTRRVALLAAVAIAGAGCGSNNPPCQTDLAAVDAARTRALDAERKLEDAESQEEQLQRQIDAEQTRKAELEARLRELEAQIADLER